MSITYPASPLKKSRRRFQTLRGRWRWTMGLGLGGLIVLLVTLATVIIFLGERHSLITLHESSARQTAAAVQLTLNEVPTDERALISDPQKFWQSVVSPSIGNEGYVYLVDENGALLAVDSGLPREQNPADFDVLQAARDGSPRLMLYRGLTGKWVSGRAEAVPNTGVYVVTETPLSDLTPVVIRTIALWIASLLLSLLVAEWLIRRMLGPVLTPVEIMQQGARAIAEGNYRTLIRLPAGTEREMAELGRAFNTIVSRLQDSQKQIDAFTNQMDEIVDLRARELSRKAQRLEVAAEVSGKIATILDPRALMKEVEDLIRARFVVYHVEILLLDSQSGALTPGRNTDRPAIMLHEHATSVIAWVARNGKTLYVPNVNEEPRYRRDPHLPASQCELAIPLRFGGRVIGVLNLESEHRQPFSKDDIAVLESLGNEIAVAIHNAQVFDALETANRDLAQATLQAKQANVLKSRFLLNASHKLRTPLNVIIGYSETILSGMYGPVPDKMADRQSRILENGRHLQALIEDMLDLSSIETGHMELSLEWVDLPPLLEEVMNATRALHQTGHADHDLAIRLDKPDTLPPIWADPNRLRYILISLMGNAVKFTSEGEIVMSAETRDNMVQIHVKDTGPGIREDELSVLFEPFQHQRGSTAGEGKGTGLGLPVSRLLALMHGGDLTVDSVLHRGSTFTLTLPCRPEGAPPPPSR